jgi:preprotein translocase subunit YajC
MLIFAQTAAPAAPPGGGGGGSLIELLGSLWWVIAIVAIMYFLLIAPQRKKEKQRQTMLKSIKKNDRVVTIGGLHGLVKNVTDEEVTLLVDDKRDVTMRFNRSAIYSILESEGKEQGELPKKESKE